MRAGAILDRDGAYGIAVALCRNEQPMQKHVDTRPQHKLVEHAFDSLRIEHDEHAAKPLRPGERFQCAQVGHHFLGDAADRGPGFWAERIEAAIREHIAQRGGAAEESRGLDQQRARATPCRRDRCRNARAASADHEHVVALRAARMHAGSCAD